MAQILKLYDEVIFVNKFFLEKLVNKKKIVINFQTHTKGRCILFLCDSLIIFVFTTSTSLKYTWIYIVSQFFSPFFKSWGRKRRVWGPWVGVEEGSNDDVIIN